MNSLAQDLYDRQIVERARNPLHAGDLPEPDLQGEGRNPLCGDRTRLDIALQGHHISQIRHRTRGCALCTAAADMLAERLSGCSVEEARAVGARFSAMLVAQDAPAQTIVQGAEEQRNDPLEGMPSLGVMEPLTAVRFHKARIRCVELPWVALKEALAHVRV
ncbi:iron-sulfur cluster assembly scaffold protein [Acetobacter papayae]|uniref:iron-sulfur cluster assembly scaffold protein n=1 Tax=Acetobacter papayae TaxID=1076592 RepID=UPI000687B1D6|nr:iron-sulfur cluster assembly scaffold protein [Acetobacter papayae]